MKNIIGILFFFLFNTFAYADEMTTKKADDDVLDIIAPVLQMIASDRISRRTDAMSAWGARSVNAAHRPKRAWLSKFKGVKPINVPSDFATVDEALNNCAPGYCVVRINKLQLRDTVYLDRPKTKLIGAPGNRITYVDRVGGTGAFFEIERGAHQIALEGLNLDGKRRPYGNKEVFGVMIYGKSINRIAIQNNHIHGLNSNRDAHGIAVYGTGRSAREAISDIFIAGNYVHNMRTGSSESIVVNGNVRNWEISRNKVHQVNNIAIDAIGGEGTSPVRVVNGRTLPGLFDAARYGFIERNEVIGMTTRDNPAYGRRHSWAGAIYVDGAHHIVIANNRVSKAEWAYDIGAENCVTPNNILLENNVANRSYYGDFIIGGYAPVGFRKDRKIQCNPLRSNDNKEGHGYVERVTVRGNKFNTRRPVDDQGTINLQLRIRHTIIAQPGLGVQAVNTNGVVRGDENSIRTN